MDRYLDIGHTFDGELSKLTVCGEIDRFSGGWLRERLHQAQSSGGAIRLDLSQVSFIDSAGIKLLAEAADRARAAGGSLSVTGSMAPQVRRLFDLLQVERLLAEA